MKSKRARPSSNLGFLRQVSLTRPDVVATVASSGSTVSHTALHTDHLAELNLMWALDKRMPTLSSRKAWAVARGANPAAVNSWFQRKRYADGSRRGIRLPNGTYDLHIGDYPFTSGTDEGMSVKFKSERDIPPPLHDSRKRMSWSYAPVRHTRAHEMKPNPLCLTCSQAYLDSTSTESVQLVMFSAEALPRNDIEVKRERAASPVLLPSNLVEESKTRTNIPVRREAVKRESSPMLDVPRPVKLRKLKHHKASNQITPVSTH